MMKLWRLEICIRDTMVKGNWKLKREREREAFIEKQRVFLAFWKREIIIFWKIYKRISLSIRTRFGKLIWKIFSNRLDRKFMDKIILDSNFFNEFWRILNEEERFLQKKGEKKIPDVGWIVITLDAIN